MPSAEVQKMIPQIREYLATQPVERAYLFGSCSRGEETPESDIDILVSLDYTQPIGMRYFGFAFSFVPSLSAKHGGWMRRTAD